MERQPRILFYFLHLLGVGHVFRAKRLIEGFAKAGIAIDIIYGGDPIPGISFDAESVHYLPPIRAADNAFSHYLDGNGNRLEKPYQEIRTAELLRIFAGLTPDMILFEAFPFGRRMVRHEIDALLGVARKRNHPPLIVSSVRDILQERKKEGRNEETRDRIINDFDHVLVHSDQNIIKLDETFPLAGDIQHKLTYTGFVVPSATTTNEIEEFDVIVSAGGGAFGGDLMMTAIEAAQFRPKLKWCLAIGPNVPSEVTIKLQSSTTPNVEVRTRLENLAAHMKKAKVSVSQCGYNTAMDTLAAHRDSQCRAVFVPYDTEGQSEQLRRAQLLADAGYAINLPQSALTVPDLLKAIDEATLLPKVKHRINFDGVENSARTVRSWLDSR